MAKMKQCKNCGALIPASSKVCPSCGAKNTKPIFKRVWFWVLVVIVAFLLWPTGDGEESTQQPVEYTSVTAEEMYDELYENAARAEEKYNDAYVAVTGELSTIDSDGSYISLVPEEHPLDSVMCYLKNDEQREIVKGLTRGDVITVKGQIKDVGEVMGYSMNVDSIGD